MKTIYKNQNNKDLMLRPHYITGFSDGEASFSVSINKDNNQKTGWRVQAQFAIGLHSKDLPLLSKIKDFFWAPG